MGSEHVQQLMQLWKGEYAWMAQVFLVVLLTMMAGFVVRQTLKGLLARTRETKNVVDDVLFEALLGPSRGLIWIIGITFAAHIVGRRTEATIFDAVDTIREVGIVAMLMWFALRFVKLYEKAYITRKEATGEHVDRTLVTAISKLVRMATFITAGLIILQTIGISISGLLAAGGVGGIAVGFAARDIIANLFGGLTVYLDRPFAVGDWIRSPDRDIEGTVEEIGWRRTVIRTFDLRPLYVPNAVFTTISVENPSRMLNRRIHEKIGVRYDDVAQVPGILNDVRTYLRESPDIDQSRTLMVNFNEFGASSLDFFIYTFTRTRVWAEYHMVKEKVLLDIAAIIARHGAEVAFPTTTVHVPNEIRLTERATIGRARAGA